MSSDDDRKRLKARWTITAELKLTAAAQIGTHDSDICDSSFERNAEGKPVLRGSAIAGALRSSLQDSQSGYLSNQHSYEEKALFGFMDGKNGQESRLICFDSFAEEKETSIRDGVGIDPKTGLAAEGKKYDRELLLPGARFPLRFDILVTEKEEETSLLSAFCASLEGLCNREIHFGSRRTRGLGEVEAMEFRAIRYDLSKAEGWLEYAGSDDTIRPIAFKPDCASALKAVENAADFQIPETRNDARKKLQARLHLEFDSTLLIRSPGRKYDSPDAVHLNEQGLAILSGTSFAGALRAHIGRILRTVNPDNAKKRLENLLGAAPDSEAAPFASRLRVTEGVLQNNRSYIQSRIQVDRFTGGTIAAALFDEQPAVGGTCEITLEIRNPEEHEPALIALALRDLLEGLFTLGGGAAIGRGRVSGTANLILSDGSEAILSPDKSGNITIENESALIVSHKSLTEGAS